MIRKISDRAKPGSISLGLGEPDLPTPEVIIREAMRVIQEEKWLHLASRHTGFA